MTDKVFVLEDSPFESLPPRPHKPVEEEEAAPGGKNPAWAASLSLFLWGGGDFYNGQRARGRWLLLLQILYLGVLIGAGLSWPLPIRWLDRYFRFGTTVPALLILLVTWGMAGWVWGTFHAYREADRGREPFAGREQEGIAALCSCAVPGWGQYLNGQPLKGAIFQTLLFLEVLAWITLVAAYTGFETLRRPENRAFLETVLLVAAAALPLLTLPRVLSAYDAFRVARYPGLRQPPWHRAKFALTRYWTGTGRGLPSMRRCIQALVLILLLVGADFLHSFLNPRTFYASQAASLAHHLRGKGMVQIPALLNTFRDRLGHPDPPRTAPRPGAARRKAAAPSGRTDAPAVPIGRPARTIPASTAGTTGPPLVSPQQMGTPATGPAGEHSETAGPNSLARY
jgi:TM2 domain-containing membrane protein YozV